MLRIGPTSPSCDGLVAAAARRGLPLAIVDLPEEAALADYRRGAILTRPDLFIAWSGDEDPHDPDRLLDDLLGLATSTPAYA